MKVKALVQAKSVVGELVFNTGMSVLSNEESITDLSYHAPNFDFHVLIDWKLWYQS